MIFDCSKLYQYVINLRRECTINWLSADMFRGKLDPQLSHFTTIDQNFNHMWRVFITFHPPWYLHYCLHVNVREKLIIPIIRDEKFPMQAVYFAEIASEIMQIVLPYNSEPAPLMFFFVLIFLSGAGASADIYQCMCAFSLQTKYWWKEIQSPVHFHTEMF